MPSTSAPNPYELVGPGPFRAAARRDLTVFGSPVELVLLPGRRARGGVPDGARPPFRAAIAERILAEEALWRAPGVVLTPNRFPFAEHHALLWADERSREPTPALLETALRIVATHGGMVLGNCIGAAASIQRAHVHLVPRRLPFLSTLPATPLRIGALIDELTRFDLVRPGPLGAIGIRGSIEDRVGAALRMLELRMTAAFNLIGDHEALWFFPRALEAPVPHYPYALGAAELSGRWCYGEPEPFEAADPQRLERALTAALVPATSF